jgi:nickel-dependent lactate racemase
MTETRTAPGSAEGPPYRVAYGRGAAWIEASELEGREVVVLAPKATESHGDGEETIQRALEGPIGERLRVLARGARSAAILVPGVDRVAAVGRFVPKLLEELGAAGVARDRTTVYLATGTHRHRGVEDLRALLGAELAASVPCLAHDPNDDASLVDVGETTLGTRVRLARAVLEADVTILTGRVIPHYFAGFGGGRKALLPGAAARSTILANHKLTLAPERGIAPHVDACSLEENPVHLDMLEGMRMVGPTFALNLLLSTAHDVVSAVAGDPEASHAAACARALELHQLRVREPFDALVTSAGGAPYDCSFVQALKAIFNVRDLVRPGSAVLWVAECPEGVMPAFLEWAKIEDDAAFEREARRAYDLGAHNTVMLRAFSRVARVALVSGLPPGVVRRLGLEPMATVEAGVAWLRAQTAPGARIGVVPFANVTHATLERTGG